MPPYLSRCPCHPRGASLPAAACGLLALWFCSRRVEGFFRTACAQGRAGVAGSGPRGLSVLPVRIPLPRCGKPARCVSPREVNQQLRQSTGGPITCRAAWPRAVADSSAAVVRVPVVTFSSPAADRGPWTAFGLRSSRVNAAPRMQPVSETLLSECARDEPAWMREGRPAPTCWILPSSF